MKLWIFILPPALILAGTAWQTMKEKGRRWWPLFLTAPAASVLAYLIQVMAGNFESFRGAQAGRVEEVLRTNAPEKWGLLFVLLVLTAAFFWLRRCSFPVSLGYVLLFLFFEALVGSMGMFYPKTGPWLAVLLVLFFFLYEGGQRFLRQNWEQRTVRYQNQILEQQVLEVQNIYQTMRGWRHDYHNHMQVLKAYLTGGQEEQAREYLSRLEQDLDHVAQWIETGNVRVDAIVNSKISLAAQSGIDINYKVTVPEKLTVRDIDLCVLIGNLIDNGVEACEKMETGQKFIRLYIGVVKKQLYVSCTNATGELARKLDEEYITSKRGNHGHGLKRINGIVEKYGGYINRKNEPGVFVTEIMLPL